jgi:hypothetical protein
MPTRMRRGTGLSGVHQEGLSVVDRAVGDSVLRHAHVDARGDLAPDVRAFIAWLFEQEVRDGSLA